MDSEIFTRTRTELVHLNSGSGSGEDPDSGKHWYGTVVHIY